MDKLTAIKIKYDDGTYSDEIPVSVLSENVEWDNTHTLVDVLGSINVVATGTIQDQISQLFNEKVSNSDMQTYVTNSMPTYITNWLNTNVNPVGSAVVVDSSLTVSGAAADAKVVGDNLDDLKSALNKIYDDGQLLNITQQTLLHPTGDGTVTVENGGVNFTIATLQDNNLGFSFSSVVGKTYTASIVLRNIDIITNGSRFYLFAVKGTSYSSTKYLAKSENLTKDGSYTITFEATTTTTTIWIVSNYKVRAYDAKNIVCTDGWGYNGLDTEFTQENRPAQGKAVGYLADKISDVETGLNKILVDNNLITITASTLLHTAGNASVTILQNNGFTSANNNNTNNLYGFVIETQAQEQYTFKFTLEEGTLLNVVISPSEIYNASSAIWSESNIVEGSEVEVTITALTNKTSVWFNQRYNISQITVDNISFGDNILRYKKYIMDYPGREIEVFNKILCIGDSITEGTFNYTSGGTSNNVIVEAKYSYPAILHKMTGCEVSNYGYGGDTAASWYNRYQNTDLSGHDACIIMLGINDGVNRVGVESFRTGMTNIINKVKNENAGIKLFVATIIPGYSDYDHKFDEYIAEIRRLVAEDFPDAFLIDINEYSECKYYTYYVQGHLTAIGYQKLAQEFITLISYTIHNNLQAFRNVQFIGTSMTYDEYF